MNGSLSSSASHSRPRNDMRIFIHARLRTAVTSVHVRFVEIWWPSLFYYLSPKECAWNRNWLPGYAIHDIDLVEYDYTKPSGAKQCWDNPSQLLHMAWLDSDSAFRKCGLTRDSRRHFRVNFKTSTIRRLLNPCALYSRHDGDPREQSVIQRSRSVQPGYRERSSLWQIYRPQKVIREVVLNF